MEIEHAIAGEVTKLRPAKRTNKARTIVIALVGLVLAYAAWTQIDLAVRGSETYRHDLTRITMAAEYQRLHKISINSRDAGSVSGHTLTMTINSNSIKAADDLGRTLCLHTFRGTDMRLIEEWWFNVRLKDGSLGVQCRMIESVGPLMPPGLLTLPPH